tara:strand:+ start:5101 stop:5436 length:336 start_codon:yes stop_codon:yes gene_type:complete
MDENNKKKWSEISEDIAGVSENIKNKIQKEEVIDDLKESFDNVLHNTSEVIKNLIDAIETTVQDEEVKEETREVLRKISKEFNNNVENSGIKISQLFNDFLGEEEKFKEEE